MRITDTRDARINIVLLIVLVTSIATLTVAIFIIPASALSTGINNSKTLNINAINVAFVNGTAVCSDGNAVYALNSSGVLWKAEVPSKLLDTSGNYTVAAGNGIVSLILSNGTVLWRKSINGVRTIAVSNTGFVVVGTDSGEIYLLNSSGGVVWSYNTKTRVDSVSIFGNFIAVSDVYGNIYYFKKFGKFPWSFTSENGDVAWMYRTGWCVWKYNGLSKMCTYPEIVLKVNEKGVFVISKYMQYAYLFSKSGYEMWNYSFDSKPISFSCDRKGDIYTVGCSNGALYVFNKDGKVMWRMKFNEGVVSAVSENGKFVATASGNLICLFSSSGNLLWFSYTPARVESLAVSNKGRIVTAGGDVYFVVPRVNEVNMASPAPTATSTPAPTPTPKHTPSPKPTPKPTYKPAKPTKPKTSEAKESLLKYIVFIPVVAGAIAGSFAVTRLRSKKAKVKKARKVKAKTAKTKAKTKKVKASKTSKTGKTSKIKAKKK